ncbi:ABC transporter permease [Kineococcus aurantiacus]|uniref:Ribose transport system permease protein n=1 Tax=Kineococcus aurantiacus TaxID=37633 RepID=A0A7Y9DQ30_9ACTN|nr:ABC transporter permease [Kineococcus aurantiacus]NYD24730.1 ribose transport system permease protein [Kineococcus aurantiacus]
MTQQTTGQTPGQAPGQATGQAAPRVARGAGGPRATRAPRVRAHGERFALLGAWALVLAVFCVLRPDTYATAGNLQSVLGSQAVLLIVSLGVLLPLTTGEFDLSVASTLSLSAMVTAVLNVQHGWGIGTAVLAGVGSALVVGLANAVGVVRFGIPSFIVTLGSGTFALGVVQWISGQSSVTGIDPALVSATVGSRFLGVPLQFYAALLAAVVLALVLEFTPLGRRLLFVGRSPKVAELSGFAVDRLRAGAFLGASLIAGLAGVVYAGALGGADPSSGQSFLLPAFAAAYLGATAIVPGRFNPIGTVVAVYFLSSGVVGLQMMGAQSFVQQLFYGGALVVAVGLSRYVRHRAAAAG